MRSHYFITYFICALLTLSTSAFARTPDMQLCDQSIETVSKATFVPQSVLLKIARLRSGRRFQDQTVSWPWTLNNAGEGHYFSSRSAASDKLRKLLALGRKKYRRRLHAAQHPVARTLFSRYRIYVVAFRKCILRR